MTGETRREKNPETGEMETTSTSYRYDPLVQRTEFAQSTGYSESYTYDPVGNIKQKIITPGAVPGQGAAPSKGIVPIPLMSYNKGNQLTSMQNGRDKLTYQYKPITIRQCKTR